MNTGRGGVAWREEEKTAIDCRMGPVRVPASDISGGPARRGLVPDVGRENVLLPILPIKIFPYNAEPLLLRCARLEIMHAVDCDPKTCVGACVCERERECVSECMCMRMHAFLRSCVRVVCFCTVWIAPRCVVRTDSAMCTEIVLCHTRAETVDPYTVCPVHPIIA